VKTRRARAATGSSYFDGLNYSLANEDSQVESDLLPLGTRSVLAVAGSGARVLPLLSKEPATLTVIDLSPAQLALTELRIALARSARRSEFLEFMGYREAPAARRLEIFHALPLSEETKARCQSEAGRWAPYGWIYLGRWERHFLKINRILRSILGTRIDQIFAAPDLATQVQAYERHWRRGAFRAFLKVFASDFVFNTFLYRGQFAGSQSDRTESRPTWQFLDEEFDRTFRTRLVRRSFFLQLLFLGKVAYEDGLPPEADAEVLSAVRSSATLVSYTSENLLESITRVPYDFYSLSDTLSYLPSADARAMLSRVHPEAPTGARLIFRSFLRAPAVEGHASWRRMEADERWAARTDRSVVYRFHFFEKIADGSPR
jgi:S-adenosylmethionine-diacylglycerol 3-amino-3-carboxypropyl transferase